MEYKNSAIGIGTWAFGADYWGEQKHSDSIKTIHRAVKEGYTLFDTAPVYGKGRSEQLLGQQLPKNRDNISISTKCFTKPVASVKKSIEHSLKRLNCDYIDNFFIHWPSTKDDFRPVVELLEEYRTLGIINNIGVSNFNKEELIAAQSAGNIDMVQNGFNFFWRGDIEFFKFCKENSIKTQAYSPLAQGLLTGKYSIDTPYKKDGLRDKMALFFPENIGTVYKYIKKLEQINNNKTKLSTLMLKWTIGQDYIDTIIVGCRNRAQVEELSNIEKLNITPEETRQIEELSIEVGTKIKCNKNIFNHSY